MFLRNDHGLEFAGAGVARSFGRAIAAPPPPLTPWEQVRERAAGIDWVPDLGAAIGSRAWWRGLATCTALCAGTSYFLAPDLGPIAGVAPAPLAGAQWEEARAQGIAPLAWGASTGRRMAANDLVNPLAEAPERPVIELAATLGEGDAFAKVLERAGVGRGDALAAAELVRETVALEDIAPGTRLSLTLGMRDSKMVARPLETLKMRARFDMAVSLTRNGGELALNRHPIAIDRTPLRIQGLVGGSLYRSARAAGAPAKLVESYIRAIATKLSLGRDVGSDDRFDMVIDRERAATGETRLGKLQLAGIERGGKPLQLIRWAGDNGEEWWDANGENERRGFMGMPTQGRITSNFGYRTHPLLRFVRLHKGMDIGAPHGAPIYAVLDGVVQNAGRAGGYGNFVKLSHAGGLGSGYGHMSRFAVRSGERVRQGQVIGYVGSTGMSTGPHLHWEVWKNGRAINPKSISFTSVARLSGDEFRRFKARVRTLLGVSVGG
ncbi:M23 family metallopeptidase [Sphingomonas bacterium]|uniref:M23 family metallopeptidase n=1 Tax=Sphingomonas bacterium TaxID=1895847 RepID=UPI0026190A5C|nr:M23 family metallopeptidase [Sphingomonas bacterium]